MSETVIEPSTAGGAAESQPAPARLLAVFLVALRLGLTSFGGPIAHLGYFREEYVARRKWLDERSFADLVALCQLLPGPASSQLGIAVGTLRAGPLGGFAAWLGFTMPSAIALIAFAYGVAAIDDVADAAWLHGLKVMVVAVVALAVWSMARTLCPDRPRATMAIASAAAMLLLPGALWQVAVIVAGGVLGWAFLRQQTPRAAGQSYRLSRRLALASMALFLILLIALPIAAGIVRRSQESDTAAAATSTEVLSGFYTAGSLVFGGGHVVLPLLEVETVDRGWVTEDEFVAGYAAAQAVPGPLFTFSAYLGATIDGFMPAEWLGGLFALGAIFLPSFLLVWGVLPFWDRLRASGTARSAIMGINAAVVGLLLAALYDPVWVSAIAEPEDFALALALFALLAVWKLPPWLVVGLAAAGGIALEWV
jgi:chromate transporter